MPDSLFGSSDEEAEPILPATRACPPIEGLYILRNAVPDELQRLLVQQIAARQFFHDNVDQAMLWDAEARQLTAEVWQQLPAILHPLLPPALNTAILAMQARLQVIVNLYEAGRGISPHVDLVSRYAGVVLGISLLSSTVMHFHKDSVTHAALLEPGDVYVLSAAVRYKWKHGIPARRHDLVGYGCLHRGAVSHTWQIQQEDGSVYKMKRCLRLSITLREMLPQAEVLL
jgi:alkylated DNA repair dioxygenase AlkB